MVHCARCSVPIAITTTPAPAVAPAHTSHHSSGAKRAYPTCEPFYRRAGLSGRRASEKRTPGPTVSEGGVSSGGSMVSSEPMNEEDLIEVERAGRRCESCRTGRAWRQLRVVRPADREPVVLCSSCSARYGDDPPVGRRSPRPVSEPAPVPAKPKPRPAPKARERRSEPPPDRLRAALRELPSSFSTAMAARAARLNPDRTLARLEQLEAAGEIRRVGNRWSTQSPPSELDSAIDRLQAQTSNLRIVRDRARAR
jgi:hypothetical protein